MKKKNFLLTLSAIVLFSGFAMAQGLVQGVVKDANTDETLIGATAMIEGTTIGITTNLDGSFILITPVGEHVLLISYVGYEDQKFDITVKDGSTYNVGNIDLKSSAIGLDEVNVLASIAVNRKTPVAVSTIDAKTIETQLGSQEFPEVMKISPNVYATKMGGGFGDSRVNIRGFDQRNVAVMINGIPVNDMENGWVYWSNWAGLGDATKSIQIQRGLGASKLAINSVGGTINIITKTTDMNKGGSVLVSATDYGRFKSMVTLSTGRLKSGTSVTFVGSRTFGKGYVDATWVDAWSYFLSVSQEIGKDHQLVFTLIGAPQQHGQRDGFNMLNQETFDKYGSKYNRNWGWRGGEELNMRVNYYHKPQAAINWYYNINEKAFLATSLYFSTGRGGGSGALGVNIYDDASGDRYYYKFEPPQTSSGQYDWDEMSDINAYETLYDTDPIYDDDGNLIGVDTNRVYPAGESKHIIRNSVNSHNWYGLLSTLTYTFNDNWVLTAGIDNRHYKGEHYREVRDLLGGDYWTDSKWGQRVVGDKVAYWNDGIVNYSGLFSQIEYSSGNFDAFLAGTMSNTWTKRIDYRSYLPEDDKNVSETLSNVGYNAKIGANYNIDEHHNIFVNGGIYSRVPFFRFHYLNFRNDVNPNLKNEKIYAGELGYGFKTNNFDLRVNGYYTIWDDISQLTSFQADDGSSVNAFMSDLQEIHAGIELEMYWQATHWMNLGGTMNFGDWKYGNDATATLYDDATQQPIGEGITYTKDLKVPDQPQRMYGIFGKFQLSKSIDFGLNWLYYDGLYASFTPESRKDPDDREQSWQLPAYNILDLRFGWRFKFAGLDSYFNVNMYNVGNTIELVEAEDTTDDDGNHVFKKGFWSWGRNFNFSLKINF